MIKVGLSPSKKPCVCFVESPLKKMKNVFYLWLFHLMTLGNVDKTTWLER